MFISLKLQENISIEQQKKHTQHTRKSYVAKQVQYYVTIKLRGNYKVMFPGFIYFILRTISISVLKEKK